MLFYAMTSEGPIVDFILILLIPHLTDNSFTISNYYFKILGSEFLRSRYLDMGIPYYLICDARSFAHQEALLTHCSLEIVPVLDIGSLVLYWSDSPISAAGS